MRAVQLSVVIGSAIGILTPSLSLAGTLSVTSVSTSTASLENGGSFELVVVGKSDLPIRWLHYSYEGPGGKILEGGHGAHFKQTEKQPGANEWTYTLPFEIPAWAPTGNYRFTSIAIQNEKGETSETYQGATPSVAVKNIKIETSIERR